MTSRAPHLWMAWPRYRKYSTDIVLDKTFRNTIHLPNCIRLGGRTAKRRSRYRMAGGRAQC